MVVKAWIWSRGSICVIIYWEIMLEFMLIWDMVWVCPVDCVGPQTFRSRIGMIWNFDELAYSILCDEGYMSG